MGAIGSGRHLGTRRACIEEVDRQAAPEGVCPRCARSARYLYTAPLEVAFRRRVDVGDGLPACRRCLGLTYRARQMHNSAAQRACNPVAYALLQSQLSALLSGRVSLCEPPPPEVEASGRRAVARWFRERDAGAAQLERVLALLNAVPPEMVWRLRCGVEVERVDRRRRADLLVSDSSGI